MIWLLLGAHLLGVAAAAMLGRANLRAGLLAAAVAPALTATWAVGRLAGDAPPETVELWWVEGLDLSLRFRADALALLLTVLVSGIGALVFVYARGYFGPAAGGDARFPSTLLAFSASMLGLVLADSVWTFFIFWEFTSVTSFLLVGHKNVDAAVRAAARRALLITGGGGLVLLAGLLLLTDRTGSPDLTGLAAIPDAPLAAVLILIGAATKSAQFPFHVWLPGAMAAPTPVSAYLHSATMVKAGVLLIAVTGPAFTSTPIWTVLGLAFGISSMVWGAVGALRHRDAKLILAWGTVSQLGLLVTLLSVGSAKATFAALSIFVAHALFKAALFLVVGEIDVRTGTRDIGELGGLARSMPIAFGVAVAAGASMAGAPPLLGFPAKEAAIEGVLGLSGVEGLVTTVAVVGGSLLTVAYTTRFLLTVFGDGPATKVAPRRLEMTVPAVILAGAGLVGYAALGVVTDAVGRAAVELDEGASVYSLLRWPGLTTASVISAAILAGGAILGTMAARRDAPAPEPVGAENADGVLEGVLDLAPKVTASVQHGSLPVYLITMAIAMTVAAAPFLADVGLDHLRWWDHPLQGALAVAIVGAGLAGGFVRSRLGAALTLGAVGTGVSGLFILHGAPDLALTQLIVETVIVVGFVLGLGHLTRRFPPVGQTWRTVRMAGAAAGGLAVMIALAAASRNPVGEVPIVALTEGAVDEGGGKNLVNVILTDIRALDTLGEVVVLATVAIGILALANARDPEPQG